MILFGFSLVLVWTRSLPSASSGTPGSHTLAGSYPVTIFTIAHGYTTVRLNVPLDYRTTSNPFGLVHPDAFFWVQVAFCFGQEAFRANRS